MSSVKDLIAQLDAAKLEAERQAREEQRERTAQEQAAAAAAAEEAAALEAAAQQAAKEAAQAERERWRVDEQACAHEVAELKRKMVEQIEKPKPKKIVQVKSTSS